MGKTRDLFEKIGVIKEIFHARTSMIKDRKYNNLSEAEDIKQRWQEHTEELYVKGLIDLDNHDGVVTHLELDTVECEVKWALGSITSSKASGGDGIKTEQFQILKDDAVRVLHAVNQQIWRTQRGHGTGKGNFRFNLKKRQCQRMFKLLYNCTHFTC